MLPPSIQSPLTITTFTSFSTQSPPNLYPHPPYQPSTSHYYYHLITHSLIPPHLYPNLTITPNTATPPPLITTSYPHCYHHSYHHHHHHLPHSSPTVTKTSYHYNHHHHLPHLSSTVTTIHTTITIPQSPYHIPSSTTTTSSYPHSLLPPFTPLPPSPPPPLFPLLTLYIPLYPPPPHPPLLLPLGTGASVGSFSMIFCCPESEPSLRKKKFIPLPLSPPFPFTSCHYRKQRQECRVQGHCVRKWRCVGVQLSVTLDSDTPPGTFKPLR